MNPAGPPPLRKEVPRPRVPDRRIPATHGRRSSKGASRTPRATQRRAPGIPESRHPPHPPDTPGLEKCSEHRRPWKGTHGALWVQRRSRQRRHAAGTRSGEAAEPPPSPGPRPRAARLPTSALRGRAPERPTSAQRGRERDVGARKPLPSPTLGRPSPDSSWAGCPPGKEPPPGTHQGVTRRRLTGRAWERGPYSRACALCQRRRPVRSGRDCANHSAPDAGRGLRPRACATPPVASEGAYGGPRGSRLLAAARSPAV